MTVGAVFGALLMAAGADSLLWSDRAVHLNGWFEAQFWSEGGFDAGLGAFLIGLGLYYVLRSAVKDGHG